MFPSGANTITAEALVPEQLAHYIKAVSGRSLRMCGGYPAYIHENHAVLAAYPEASTFDTLHKDGSLFPSPAEGAVMKGRHKYQASIAAALAELAEQCSRVTVLAPLPPVEQEHTVDQQDAYWHIPLPAPAPSQKLRNMLRRAEREVVICQEQFGPEHRALVDSYLQTRALSSGTRSIFASLDKYCVSHPQVILFATRAGNGTSSGSLAGFTIGDFASLTTAFYMFAFRSPDAPPGTADLLLHGLVRHATEMGHTRVNLGLGINQGIGFFKKKWNATPLIPYYEYTVAPRAPKATKGFFSFLKRRS